MGVINYLTTVQFDFGALRLVGDECRRLGITRPLVVTDAGVRAAGLLDRLVEALGPLRCGAVYDGTPSNPTEAAVRAAVQAWREGECDGVIALGGGSAIDLAKGVTLLATHPGELRPYAAIEGGAARITAQVAPLIAIPTTAGTGSEVGRGAVLILDDGRKVGVLSPHLIPKSAICDPELTLGLPAGLTAATGMDAIAHCIETFLAPSFNPPADGIALDGLERGWRHLRRAVETPGDREARKHMMSASMQGALAFQKGLGCVHSLSHSLGGVQPSLHHGTLNAVFLPAVLRFNAAAPTVQADERLQRLARAMGVSGETGDGRQVAAAVQQMSADIGLPAGLGAMGVKPAAWPVVIDRALADHCHKTNPREASRADYEVMLAEST